jgi:transposase
MLWAGSGCSRHQDGLVELPYGSQITTTRGAGWFTTPAQVNHRRYEALRAFFVDGLTYQQAADRFGYTRWAMVNLVREWRAGRLELFAPPRKPGPAPGVAPAKEHVRGRVIQLRRQGLSTHEISARLGAEGTPLNRTSVGEILAEEGFGRLLRGPAPVHSIAAATPAAIATCPGPRSSTLLPGLGGWTPPGPGCC